MVVDQFFKPEWMRRKPVYSFLLAILFSNIGIISSLLIFRSEYSGLMAIGFISLLLLPMLNRLLQYEKNVAVKDRKFSLSILPSIFRDHKDIFQIYTFLFLGVFITFAIYSLFLPTFLSADIFSSQLNTAGLTGYVVEGSSLLAILQNNFTVLIVCLVLSVIYGAGAILFLTWNASVWGVAIGFAASQAAISSFQNPFLFFGLIMIPILPHLVTEAVSYLSASIAGGIFSKAVIKEKIFSKRFKNITIDALIILEIGVILVVMAALIEVFLMA